MTPEIQRFGGIAPEMSPPEAGERLSRDGHLVVRICVGICCCSRLDRQFPPFCPMLINSGIPRRNRYAPMLECTAISFVPTVACVITEDRGRMLFGRRGFTVLDAPLGICFFGGTVRFAGDAAACVSEDGGRNCDDYIDDDCNDHNDLLLRDDPLLIGRAVTGHVCPENSGTGREKRYTGFPVWSYWGDSNSRPTDYESVALPAELQ